MVEKRKKGAGVETGTHSKAFSPLDLDRQAGPAGSLTHLAPMQAKYTDEK